MSQFLAILLFVTCNMIVAGINESTYVIDGDISRVSGIHIRLNGIDAPEKNQICRTNGVICHCTE